MSLKKQFLKSKEICKVTFALSAEEVGNVDTINIAGDFNDWSETKNSLKKFKNGNFKTTIDFEKGKQIQFKYLVDGENWMNDKESDLYVVNTMGTENSVVITEQ